MTDKWTVEDMPDLKGKTAIVTGANSGIGFEAAAALARKGARVMIAARNKHKGQEAVTTIRRNTPTAKVELVLLDLASLADIKRFAQEFLRREIVLDLLINNAGVMAIPYRETADGFEMQFGTNHLGHYALTGRLLPALLAAPHARVVTVSSNLHRRGKLDFDNLNGKWHGSAHYSPQGAYAQSKLANLLFAYELERKFREFKTNAISVGCHPGYAATNLQAAGPRMEGSKAKEAMMGVANTLLAQSAAMGALPTLYAATAPEVEGGDYIGPRGMGGMRGHPHRTKSNHLSYDNALADKLWQVSEELTEVVYRFQ